MMSREGQQIENNEKAINNTKGAKGINFALIEENILYKEKIEAFTKYLRSIQLSNKLDANY